MASREPSGDNLTQLARRTDDDPFFLGSALAAYKRKMGLDDQGLAAVLGCPVETLPQLALCRRPVSATFDQDVQTIATRFDIDPLILGAIVGDAR